MVKCVSSGFLTLVFLGLLAIGIGRTGAITAAQAPPLPPECRGKRYHNYAIPRDNPTQIRHAVSVNGLIECYPGQGICHVQLVRAAITKDLNPGDSMGVPGTDTFIFRCGPDVTKCAVIVCD